MFAPAGLRLSVAALSLQSLMDDHFEERLIADAFALRDLSGGFEIEAHPAPERCGDVHQRVQ